MINLGLDLHGVVDTYPYKFIPLALAVKAAGGKVYIMTGASADLAKKQISDAEGQTYALSIWYDKILSITDYLKSQEVPHIQNEDGGIRVDDETWDRVKSVWAKEYQIDLHIDDSPVYGKYFEPGVYLKFNEREKR